MSAKTVQKFMWWVDLIANHLSWISVALLFLEVSCTASAHSLEQPCFLYIERAIASFFMGEYFFRVYEDWKHPELTPDIGLGKRYVTSFIGVVDLMAWLPFVLGFFLPVQYLGLVRAMRVLRLFKRFRYDVHLQLIAEAMYRAWTYLRPMFYTMVILLLFNTILIYQLEKDAQPESFGHLTNCLWFCIVSAATVGYGDMAPKTDMGKLFTALFNFLPAIFVFSGMVGAAGGMFTKVIEEHNQRNKKECE